MSSRTWISTLFSVAEAYDGILGIAFLIMPAQMFEMVAVPPPNHFGYVRFPAAVLIIFALMFIDVARNPYANRSLILYGILLKISYCGVAMSYWFLQDIPFIWKPFAVLDLGFAIAFYVAFRSLGRPRRAYNETATPSTA